MTNWRGMDEDPGRAGTYRVKLRLLKGGEVYEAFSWYNGYWWNCFGIHERLAWSEVGDEPTDWSRYLLAQGDPRWGDHVYAGGRCYTLRSQGCFIACCVMALRILGVDQDATPLTVDEAVGLEGYDGCYLKWSAINGLGLSIKGTTYEIEAAYHVEQGGVAFVEVEPASLMHFVAAVEYDGDFLVLDPWKNTVDKLRNLYAGAESFRIVGAF